MRRAALSLAVLLALPAAASADGGTSTVLVFEGLRASKGVVEVALFDREQAYAARKGAVRTARVPVTDHRVSVRFEGVEPGRYGVMAYHDLNGDGRLNLNPVGIPAEPYAFSNNAAGRFGPAPWRAAAFQAGAGETRQVITLK